VASDSFGLITAGLKGRRQIQGLRNVKTVIFRVGKNSFLFNSNEKKVYRAIFLHTLMQGKVLRLREVFLLVFLLIHSDFYYNN
jgi:hypothetical protein